jgi:ABC-type uncharacterized transport system permease subunit
MPNLSLYLLTFSIYGLLSVFFWRVQLQGKDDAAVSPWLGYAVLLPLALHGYLLFSSLWVGSALNMGLVSSISMIFWLTLAVYWLANFFYPLSSLKTLVLPLAAIASVLPALFPKARPVLQATTWAFDAHVLVAMLAYSLFTIAALHAGLMSLVEKRLHRASLPRVLRTLPPLLTMEKLLFRIIGVGFVLLTLTLASGVLFSEQIFGRPMQLNHKVVFGFISWLVFAVLLAGHQLRGWRGRTAVRWTMSGFALLVLAYIGTQFVLEVILHR